MSDKNEQERYEKAKQRVERLKAFYKKLIVFAVVMAALLLFNMYKEPNNLWSLWIGAFWGLALIFQAFSIFTIRDSFLGSEWEKRTLEKMMNKDKEKK